MTEWSHTIIIAIVVLVVIILVGIVFVFVNMGLGVVNQQAENLGSSIASLDLRAFDAYNQSTISGNSVIAAVQHFRNQPVGVIVRTLGSSQPMNYAALLAGTDPSIPSAVEDWLFDASQLEAIGDPPMVERLTTQSMFVHFDIQNGNMAAATNRASEHFINPTGRFRSVLIHDINDEIIGIYMEQLPTATASIENAILSN